MNSIVSAKNPSKFLGNHEEKNTVNYLHKILVKSPSIYTSCIMSVIAPIHALSVLSIHPSDDKHQEIWDDFPDANYGEKNPSEIMQESLMTLP